MWIVKYFRAYFIYLYPMLQLLKFEYLRKKIFFLVKKSKFKLVYC